MLLNTKHELLVPILESNRQRNLSLKAYNKILTDNKKAFEKIYDMGTVGGRELFWVISALRGSLDSLGCILDFMHDGGMNHSYIHKTLIGLSTCKLRVEAGGNQKFNTFGDQVKQFFQEYMNIRFISDDKVWFLTSLLSKNMDLSQTEVGGANSDAEQLEKLPENYFGDLLGTPNQDLYRAIFNMLSPFQGIPDMAKIVQNMELFKDAPMISIKHSSEDNGLSKVDSSFLDSLTSLKERMGTGVSHLMHRDFIDEALSIYNSIFKDG